MWVHRSPRGVPAPAAAAGNSLVLIWHQCCACPCHHSAALLQGDIRHNGDDEAGAVQDLNQGVNRLMAAMRDMLANIQFQEPPRDDNPEGDGDWD